MEISRPSNATGRPTIQITAGPPARSVPVSTAQVAWKRLVGPVIPSIRMPRSLKTEYRAQAAEIQRCHEASVMRERRCHDRAMPRATHGAGSFLCHAGPKVLSLRDATFSLRDARLRQRMMTPLDLPDPLFQWLGHFGVAVYLGAYALLQAGILRGSGYLYTLANLTAAALVLAGLTVAFNLSSALIQVFWIGISLFGLARMVIGNRRARFSSEERRFLDRAFPTMPKAMARRFLDGGNWMPVREGHVLTTEGAPVGGLTYLFEGRVEVSCGGHRIGSLTKGFVGEMNVLSGGPASATVVAAAPGRAFTISGETLRRLHARDADFRALLDEGLIRDTRRKLVAANVRLSEAETKA